VGQKAKANPKILREMIASGDVVGNHSLTHPIFPELKNEQLPEEIIKSRDIIYKITGIKPNLFRFPYGSANKELKNYVISQGMKPVFWGYTPDDYLRPGAKVIAERVIQHACSGQIILLHDGPTKRQQTIDALPKIIEGVKKKGLGFSVLCS
jgi:peptidoglycan-N-acetylglucosamine deacetylase